MSLLYQIQLRNDLAANWTSANPTLAAGEVGIEVDTGKFKLGNGITAWTSLAYAGGSGGGGGGALAPNGTTSSPNLITSASGITPSGAQRELQFIQGSAAAITISKVPAISAGTTVGQELILQGTNDANTVTINNGTGVSLNGPIVMGATGAGARLYLIWDGTNWGEVSRR